MDKRVNFAVAGSGKTTYIINKLNLDKRSLIITYTNNNIKNLKDGIVKKFKYFPNNIILMPYFNFLYSFCLRPFLSYKFRTQGINYDRNPNKYAKQADIKVYFFDKQKRIYSNRIVKFLESQGVLEDINLRVSKYFDNLFIDEIQDFAGCDFNFLKSIAKINIEMIFVGDFYQHTFDTSRDGIVNKNLHKDYTKYKNFFRKMGIAVDLESLKKSYRCSPTICKFITDRIGIEIGSHKTDETKICFINDSEQADEIFKNKDIIKLFYQENYKYGCYSKNWGECKGENRYGDVCVVLNKMTLTQFENNKLDELKPQTKNRLYVACSRANNDLYFVSYKFFEKYKK